MILKEYESQFAAFVGSRHARATMLGRQALVLLLKALGIDFGDKIGVCSFTCLSVIEAIKVTGADPFYLDIDEHLAINPAELSKLPKNFLKAVILQHTFGNPGKLAELIDVCNSINALIVEDCAHALGCYWNGKHLGQFGHGAIFSFQWGKPYSTGQGGMVVFNSDEIGSRIDELIDKYASTQSLKCSVAFEIQRKIRSLAIQTGIEARLRSFYKSFIKTVGGKELLVLNFEHQPLKGYFVIPDDLTVRTGLRQLAKYGEVMRERRRNTDFIISLFKKNKIKQWNKLPNADLTLLRYPVFVRNKQDIMNQSQRNGWDVAGWYESTVHPLQNEELNLVGYKKEYAPNAEILIDQLIHFPTYHVSEDRMRLIINTFWKRNN